MHHQRKDDEAARILDARLHAIAKDECRLYANLAHAVIYDVKAQTRLLNPLLLGLRSNENLCLKRLHETAHLARMTALCTTTGKVMEPRASLSPVLLSRP